MAQVKHIVLDVLKPHQPSVLELAKALADAGPDQRVTIDVRAVDEKTESVLIDIQGQDIELETLVEVIKELGATVHSVDQVEVHAGPDSPED